MSTEQKLSRWILFALFAGILAGILLHDPSWSAGTDPIALHRFAFVLQLSQFFGISVFLAALKVLIVPLVASTVFVAVARIGVTQLGRLGGGALLYYFCTMLIAVGIGISAVTLLQPGAGLEELLTAESDLGRPPQSEKGVFGILENLTSLLLPTNVLDAMARGQTLSVICFFLFLGVVVAVLDEEAKLLLRLGEEAARVFLTMVGLVLYLAPLGVFCLILDAVAQHGVAMFGQALGSYMLCVVLGLLLHGLIILPLLLRLFTRRPIWRFASQVRAPLMMALGTASSSATLPVSLNAADQAGIDQKVSGVVLPLGSTVNMDGTALYEAVAVIFLAQMSGVTLGITQLLVIAFTATLAAVGAAGIPSAGLVTLFIVVDAVNESLAGVAANSPLISAAAIGLLLGVDRLLDMLRTTVNVWGDLVGAAVLDAVYSKR